MEVRIQPLGTNTPSSELRNIPPTFRWILRGDDEIEYVELFPASPRSKGWIFWYYVLVLVSRDAKQLNIRLEQRKQGQTDWARVAAFIFLNPARAEKRHWIAQTVPHPTALVNWN